MLWTVYTACLLGAVTVSVHAVGFALLLKILMKHRDQPPTDSWHITWLLIRLTWSLLLIHAIEIVIWGVFYYLHNYLPDAESAFYFSGVTYATIGYGDVVLPKPLRMMAPIEGLVGVLMCGLSTGLFFAVVNRILTSRFETKQR